MTARDLIDKLANLDPNTVVEVLVKQKGSEQFFDSVEAVCSFHTKTGPYAYIIGAPQRDVIPVLGSAHA